MVDEELPFSMFQGQLEIGDVTVDCHVLNDGRRVMTQREMVRLISGGRESGNLQRYLERNPRAATLMEESPAISFRIDKGKVANGYEATFLIEVCNRYLEARQENELHESQGKLAIQAEIIIRATAKVGITALVDEVTGYQEFRKKNALQLKLKAFIAEEMQEWAKLFPDDFWVELARLEGIEYSPKSRPLRWGKYVMAFVYDAVDRDVGKELREINPNPRYGKNHHQWLRTEGRELVKAQIWQVIGVMKTCKTMDEFKAKFKNVFERVPLQTEIDFPPTDDDDDD